MSFALAKKIIVLTSITITCNGIPKLDQIRNTLKNIDTQATTTNFKELLDLAQYTEDENGRHHKVISTDQFFGDNLTTIEHDLTSLFWTNHEVLSTHIHTYKNSTHKEFITLLIKEIYDHYKETPLPFFSFIEDILHEEIILQDMVTRIFKVAEYAKAPQSTATINDLLAQSTKKQKHFTKLKQYINTLFLNE